MASIGIITALQSEADCLGSLENNKNVTHSVAGIGASAATRTAIEFCNKECSGLISFGYAGALNSIYQSGCLAIGSSVSNGPNIFNTSSVWLRNLTSLIELEKNISFHATSFFTPPSPLITKSQKVAQAQKGDWGAVDMESYAIAEVASKNGLPFLIVRAILDELNTDIPAGSANMIAPNGRQKSLTVFYEILKKPSDFGKYLKLARAKFNADITLRRAAALIGRCRLG